MVLAWALVLGGLLAMATVPVVRVLGDALEGAQDGAALPVGDRGVLRACVRADRCDPAVAKLQLQSLDATGSVVGRLSAWATFGALVGRSPQGSCWCRCCPRRHGAGARRGAGGAGLVVGHAAGWRAEPRRRRLGPAGSAPLRARPGALGERCDAESEYFCAEVEVDPDRPSGRPLVLDDIDNSYVDLDDPRHLEFAYTRGWRPSSAGQSSAAVFVGGGGFTLPRYLAAVRPGSRSRVLEVDGKLVDLARERLGLGDVPGMSVRIGDARLTLRDERSDSADLIVGDAFSGRAVPRT